MSQLGKFEAGMSREGLGEPWQILESREDRMRRDMLRAHVELRWSPEAICHQEARSWLRVNGVEVG